MFYPDTSIDELMPDALIHSIKPADQPAFINRIGYFTRSNPKKGTAQHDISSKPANSGSDKPLKTRQVWEVHEGIHGTLPGSVLCHPSVGYSTRYGNVLLTGLNNAIGYGPSNNPLNIINNFKG